MAEYHVRRSRMPSTSSDDFEDESLDPRIQVELEKLNKASEEINRLELELDDARASFRQTLSESTQKLDVLAKKLGSCVEKARPYYEARVKAKEAHLETQRAALRFERACSMHEAAKEMVQLAEQGYMRREQPSDPAWQEMLNHATMKVNEAEKERNESELEHERTMIRFKLSEDQVQSLQKDLKRAITKSKPYFEMKARFNQIMEEHKHKVGMLEEDVSSAKSLYSTALRSLEAISDQIHRQRLERRQQQQLGVRGAGVGAECPLPPPSWEKGGGTLDGRGSLQSLDPLGVLKVTTSVAYGGSSPSLSSSRRRSRNLSGESTHGTEVEEEGREAGSQGRESGSVCDIGASTPQKEPQEGESPVRSPISSPKETVMIPGDPLGVIPPVFTTSSRGSRPAKVATSAPSITHPAFTMTPHPRATPPFVAPGNGTGSRTKSVTNVSETFVSPSMVYSNPEQARRPSYRRAVEASQRSAENSQRSSEELSQAEVEGMMGEEGVGNRDVFEAFESRQRSYSSPVAPSDPRTRSPPYAIPHAKVAPGAQEALADGRKHGSAPERTSGMCEGEEGEEEGASSSSSVRNRQKLQGLILRIDPNMDPMRHFEPPPCNTTTASLSVQPTTTRTTPSPNTTTTTTPSHGEREAFTPTPTHPTPGHLRPSASSSLCDFTVAKPIIRSASTVSYTGSERSETEFSEVESVSATQSPTKPRHARLLNVPTSMDTTVEDSSDTESLASTGPMLDDEQVETGAPPSPPPPSSYLNRNSWSRMSLPPRLSYLDGFIARAKRNSGEFDVSPSEYAECGADEGDITVCENVAGDITRESVAGDVTVCEENVANCVSDLPQEGRGVASSSVCGKEDGGPCSIEGTAEASEEGKGTVTSAAVEV
ncbi:hypothetical protein ACOMHN_023852 [Nucella lapillus]